jgi:hypothetical protein
MNGNATSLKPAWRYGLAGPSLLEIHRGVSVPRSATFLRRPQGLSAPGGASDLGAGLGTTGRDAAAGGKANAVSSTLGRALSIPLGPRLADRLPLGRRGRAARQGVGQEESEHARKHERSHEGLQRLLRCRATVQLSSVPTPT